jgi:membrane protein YqaA with SNARE-associated domain
MGMESNILMPKRIPKYIRMYHRLLRLTGGYIFLRQNLVKLLASIFIILGIFYAINAWIIDIDEAMSWVTRNLSSGGILTTFFISEISVGFITPELLILWADQTLKPVWMLVLLAGISYSSGLVSYFIGQYWGTRKVVREKLLVRHAKTMEQLRRFGALLIVLAALTPLPYPVVSQLSGLNKFPFKTFALITLVRFLRFALYGVVLFKAF